MVAGKRDVRKASSVKPCRRHCFTACLSLAILGGVAGDIEPAPGRSPDDPVTVLPGVAQLLIDDALIASQDGLQRTLHQPVKDHRGDAAVIPAAEGTTLLAYGSIVRDPALERYVMFTQEFPSRRMYRFTSPNGLKWTPGDDGVLEPLCFEPPLQPEANARGTQGFDLFSCYYDTTDSEYPYKGWMYYANYGPNREGIYFVRSGDGRRWERGRLVVNAYAGPADPTCQIVRQDGKTVYGPGDVTTFYHDPGAHRFLGVFKFFTTDKVPPGNGLRSRAYAFFEYLDQPVDTSRLRRIALLPPAAARDGNRPFDEFYASTAWRYESVWLGGLKVFHSQEDYPYSAAGCAFLKLVVSRDGLQWTKVPFQNDAGVPEVFIPNGSEGGNDGRNDGGYISEFSQGPLRIGDEIVYYYSASSYGKNHNSDVRLRGGGIFRARLRADGFVSVNRGTLTTVPLKLGGADLLINSQGPLHIDAMTAAGQMLGGTQVDGDSLRHAVDFAGRCLGTLAAGRPVRLRFRVAAGGHLYSFTVR